MPNHPGYFIDSISSQTWYRCVNCRYDSFNLENIEQHCKFSHPPVILPEMAIPLADWEAQNRLRKFRIAISFLTWNTRDASFAGIKAILAEVRRLKSLGVSARAIWFDNGSTDRTWEMISPWIEQENANGDIQRVFSATNTGQSVARNVIIRSVLSSGEDFLLMVDGDVEIVPYSTYALADLMTRSGPEIGCVGLYCRNCTHKDDGSAAPECRRIDGWMLDLDPEIAWTNYGMFRREVLEKCHFDENGPFAGPGWGFEDDDYYFQMRLNGFVSLNTKYFRHYHRRRHSSVRVLGESLAAKVWGERKAYMVQKWSEIGRFQSRVNVIANQTMPVLEY